MPLRVVEAGLFTLVVDQGRPRSRELGVPVGGAADRRSLALGNALVGNESNAAALEIALAGPTLRTDEPFACVVYGAPFVLRGDRHEGDAALHAGTTFTLFPGETLTIGGTPEGMRAYFCVRGGLEEPEILGSRSSLGPISAGQVLRCQAPSGMIRPRFVAFGDSEETIPTIRVIAGAQEDWFDGDVFYAGDYEVTPASNRMGLRLRGAPLRFRGGAVREMVSEPVAPGAVQVTRDGQCIVLGVDGQTIGGYPKVAHVIGADLDRLAQLRPGRRIRFARVGLEEAAALHRARQAETEAWLTRLRATL